MPGMQGRHLANDLRSPSRLLRRGRASGQVSTRPVRVPVPIDATEIVQSATAQRSYCNFRRFVL